MTKELRKLVDECVAEIKKDRQLHGDLLLDGTIALYMKKAMDLAREQDRKIQIALLRKKIENVKIVSAQELLSNG